MKFLIIFPLIVFVSQIGCASFWVGFGSHVLGDLAMKQYEEMKEKEKEKKDGTKLE